VGAGLQTNVAPDAGARQLAIGSRRLGLLNGMELFRLASPPPGTPPARGLRRSPSWTAGGAGRQREDERRSSGADAARLPQGFGASTRIHVAQAPQAGRRHDHPQLKILRQRPDLPASLHCIDQYSSRLFSIYTMITILLK
jgi:hypothetical protein